MFPGRKSVPSKNSDDTAGSHEIASVAMEDDTTQSEKDRNLHSSDANAKNVANKRPANNEQNIAAASKKKRSNLPSVVKSSSRSFKPRCWICLKDKTNLECSDCKRVYHQDCIENVCESNALNWFCKECADCVTDCEPE